jgi:cardiolipin synthase A/B
MFFESAGIFVVVEVVLILLAVVVVPRGASPLLGPGLDPVDHHDASRRYVHVEFYILSLDASTDSFFAALEAAVSRGVQVRILLDHLGSRGYPGYRKTCRELDRIGADWHLMLPVQPLRGRLQRPELRNHRKLLVADGEAAFVGSLNLIDPSYNKRANRRRGLAWRDMMVRVQGPVVHEVDALFVTDWYSETGQLLSSSAEQSQLRQRTGSLLCQIAPSGPGFEVENNLMLFNTLIYYAQRRLSITSPYFVSDESLLNAITTAARRGVAVELFVGRDRRPIPGLPRAALLLPSPGSRCAHLSLSGTRYPARQAHIGG